ncbi:MAG: hypothetical protein BVN35_08995 [Proteobacteria bacterium ST_bin11]|nr:MAG: hypothetical protein BVN35_08995 [Proteobacteria bacterium ST_bin11]
MYPQQTDGDPPPPSAQFGRRLQPIPLRWIRRLLQRKQPRVDGSDFFHYGGVLGILQQLTNQPQPKR